jgi:predicted nucleic acid-binding protein
MAKPAYFETSIFIEMVTPRSKHKARIRELLADFTDRRVHIYTSILTVQEMSVAVYRRGTVARDIYGDIRSIARVYNLTKEIAMTAAKIEAQLKDIADAEASKRDKSKPLTVQEQIDQACENRRRKWDCFHIATALVLECYVMYSTDQKLQKRPKQLGLKNLKIIPPPEAMRTISGPLIDATENES